MRIEVRSTLWGIGFKTKSFNLYKQDGRKKVLEVCVREQGKEHVLFVDNLRIGVFSEQSNAFRYGVAYGVKNYFKPEILSLPPG